MGCGSSSLKGDSPSGANNDAPPQPIKKVATNFSTIDYDSAATNRRDTVYAPHDEIRHKSDALSPLTEKTNNPIDSSIAGVTGQAPSSTQPLTTNSEGLAFDNAIATQPDKHAEISAKDDSENKPAYRDVTASPTTPGAVSNIDNQLGQQQIASTTAPRPVVQ